jgi:hypothetical protein
MLTTWGPEPYLPSELRLEEAGAYLRSVSFAPRAVVGRSELHPLGLGREDLEAIQAFVSTLSSSSP